MGVLASVVLRCLVKWDYFPSKGKRDGESWEGRFVEATLEDGLVVFAKC